MKILMVGCGGVGGYFGGRLVQAGADVTFLVRPQRLKLLQEKGLTIKSSRGDANMRVNAITKQQLCIQYDLIILTCKAYDLDQVIIDISSSVGDKTMLLPLLNGLEHYHKLQAKFSKARVLFGYCNISAGLNPQGEVVQFTSIHELNLGTEENQTLAGDIDAVVSTLKSASFNTRVAKDIWQALWEKFVFINALAGVTTLMQSDIGSVLSTTYGRNVIKKILEECQKVAASLGFAVSRRADKVAREALFMPGSKFSASMLKDIQSHKSVESEALLGNMVGLARNQGTSTPLLEAAYSRLQLYEASLKQQPCSLQH